MSMIDIRCTGRLPFLPSGDDVSRCQLVAGHEGAHALMFARNGCRMVRTWSRWGRLSVREHVAGQEHAPWARGKPAPAWTEIRAIPASAT
jgi:hypothetical protein